MMIFEIRKDFLLQGKFGMFSLFVSSMFVSYIPVFFDSVQGLLGSNVAFLVFGAAFFSSMLILAVYWFYKVPKYSISADEDGLWYSYIDKNMALVSYDSIVSIEINNRSKCLLLLGQDGQTLIRIEYQLIHFDNLCTLLRENVNCASELEFTEAIEIAKNEFFVIHQSIQRTGWILSVLFLMLFIFATMTFNVDYPVREQLTSIKGQLQWFERSIIGAKFKLNTNNHLYIYHHKGGEGRAVLDILSGSQKKTIALLVSLDDDYAFKLDGKIFFEVFALEVNGKMVRSFAQIIKTKRGNLFLTIYGLICCSIMLLSCFGYLLLSRRIGLNKDSHNERD
jgi:hypothetical protein